jgi:hypothetical protein
MQRCSLIRKNRERGPDVWLLLCSVRDHALVDYRGEIGELNGLLVTKRSFS